MKRASIPAILLALAVLLLAAQTALAHSFIDHCTPDAGASLAQPPSVLLCSFTEAIDVRQTKMSVIDARANTVDNGDLKADPNDNKGLNVSLTLNTARITGGVYTVRWQTVSEDGHETDGQFQFSVNAQPVPTIAIVSPTESSTFDTDPSDVPVTVQVANFALGQGGRGWQVYIDSNLMASVTDGSTATTLKGVKAGDYALKVVLVNGDGTTVATAGVPLSVGPADSATATPAATTAATSATPAANTTTPATLPKTGADTAGWLLPGTILALVLLALLAIGLGRGVRRAPISSSHTKEN